MAMDKPTKPTDLVPRTFGGIKNNFSIDLQETGYEPNIPQTYNGDNLNYQLDATGKELDYCEKICDFINDLPVGKTITTNANNKLEYTNAPSIATVENAGLVKPDGQTITVENDGTIKSKVSQYTKFAINKGNPDLLINNSNELAFDVDNNNPLTYTNIMGETRTVDALSPIDVSGSPYDVPFVQPVLSANGTMGGDSFAVSATSARSSYPAYNAINGGDWVSGGNRPQTYIIYSPEPLKISTLYFAGNGSSVYTPVSYTIEVSNDNSNYTTVYTATNESVRGGKTHNLNLTDYYKYIKINVTDIEASSSGNEYYVVISDIKITATYQIFTSDGTYKVALPQSGNQPYLFDGNVFIQEEEPTTQVQGDIWLNPQEPYSAKQFDGSNWQDFNDVLLLDSGVTVSSGVISNLIQPKYNSNHIEPKFQNNPQIIKTYNNGTSWYRIWSDGWCEQGGTAKPTLNAGAPVTYLVPLSSPAIFVSIAGDATGTSVGSWTNSAPAYSNSTNTGITIICDVISGSTVTVESKWEVAGYIA